MRLLAASAFDVERAFHGVLPVLPSVAEGQRRLKGYLHDEAGAGDLFPVGLDGKKDTYWAGKSLGRVSTLAWIAHDLGDTKTVDAPRRRAHARARRLVRRHAPRALLLRRQVGDAHRLPGRVPVEHRAERPPLPLRLFRLGRGDGRRARPGGGPRSSAGLRSSRCSSRTWRTRTTRTSASPACGTSTPTPGTPGRADRRCSTTATTRSRPPRTSTSRPRWCSGGP